MSSECIFYFPLAPEIFLSTRYKISDKYDYRSFIEDYGTNNPSYDDVAAILRKDHGLHMVSKKEASEHQHSLTFTEEGVSFYFKRKASVFYKSAWGIITHIDNTISAQYKDKVCRITDCHGTKYIVMVNKVDQRLISGKLCKTGEPFGIFFCDVDNRFDGVEILAEKNNGD